MRVTRLLAALAALLLSFGVAHAQPLISAWIGTPTTTSRDAYFVLDFNDTGATPETYAFGWHYEGVKTGSDFLVGLQNALTGPNGFVQEGAEFNFVTSLGYNGRSKFNDFGGGDSGDPNGYWNFWLGFDGANWTASEFGVADITLSDIPVYTTNPFTGQEALSGASFFGGRWVKDFNTDSPIAPRTPGVTVAAPEPGSLALLGIGCLFFCAKAQKNKRHYRAAMRAFAASSVVASAIISCSR